MDPVEPTGSLGLMILLTLKETVLVCVVGLTFASNTAQFYTLVELT